MTQLRKCGHPLGATSWCPECELAEAYRSGEFRGAAAAPVRCKDCDLPNGCPEYCWCGPQGAGNAEYASWFRIATDGVAPSLAPQRPALPENPSDCCPRCLRDGLLEWANECRTHGVKGTPSDQPKGGA